MRHDDGIPERAATPASKSIGPRPRPRGIGQNIKRLRLARGWRQCDLATRIAKPQQQLYWWETNRTMPSLPSAIELARVLGCSLDELVGRVTSKGAA